MIKLVEIIYPKAGLSEQAFHDHWRHPHATYCRQMRSLRSYIQCHVIRSAAIPDDGHGCVGVAEPAFDNVKECEGLVDDQIYQDYLVPDEFLFIDRDSLDITFCQDDVVYGSVSNAAASSDRFWTDLGRSLFIKYIQFFSRGEADAFNDVSAEDLARRIGALRMVRSVSVTPSSRLIGAREFFWPTLTAFEQGVEQDRAAFDALRQQQASPFAVLAQAERVV